jgi:UDP-N-acetylglucosamine 4-epimerase
VQANLLAATTTNPRALNQVFNVAVGDRTDLNTLHRLIQEELGAIREDLRFEPPVYKDFRAGDVRHSLADISKARRELGYEPTHTLSEGLRESVRWFVEDLKP